MNLLAALVCLLLVSDNNVQWAGVSHFDFMDRRPLCPVDGEPFSVKIQTYRNDVTVVRAIYDDGDVTIADAYWVRDRGPYAIWQADLPATASETASYYFEVIDGTDVDYYGRFGMQETVPAPGERFELNFTTLEHAPIGATLLSDGGTAFKVWAPTANNCVVSGEFNGWANSFPTGADRLDRHGEYFIGRVSDAGDRDQYKYIFRPGVIWKPDARPRGLNSAANYNTFIEDRFRYEWQVTDFTPPAFEDLIIYELHVGTFAGRNDPLASGAIPARYRDVARRADHLAELGINCVWLMPVTEYPWDFSAGYNPITAWAAESVHGTMDDFKAMVDALHGRGIAVIVDIVWNHFSGSDNYLWEYDGGQIYFDTPTVETPWGAQADFDRGPVREYFLHSALFWLDEMGVDGFRMDATSYMNIPPQEASGWSLMQWLNDTVDNRAIDKFVLAEQLPDNPWITRPTSLGGAGFDSQLNDYFVDTLRDELNAAAFGDPQMWKIADIIDGSGQYLEKFSIVNYLGSHDEAWPSTGGQRFPKTIDSNPPHDSIWAKGRMKLGYGVVFYAQGIPMIFYGDEWLEIEDFTGGDPGGGGRIDWSRRNSQKNIFRWFRDALKVRKTNAALRADAGIQTFHTNESGNVIAWQRFDNSGNVVVVIANFSNNNHFNYHLGMPQPGTWYELINSQHAKYDGNGIINEQVEADGGPRHGFPQSAFIDVPQMGMLVFRHNVPPDVEPCPTDFDGDLETGLADLLVVIANFGQSGPDIPGDANGDGTVGLEDLLAVLSQFGRLCP